MAIRKGKLIKNIILLIILFIFIAVFVSIYSKYNFNYYMKSVREPHLTMFERDKEVKYSDTNSYKLTNENYNDAMFFQEVQVTPNTPYRVTCMVKTENVEAKNGNSGVGAQISIEGSTERSSAVQGTTDWQEIELIFNSKNREEINIGFRLGGNLGEAKGTVWFSELKIEEGIPENNNNWNFACFIFRTTDVTIDNNNVQLQVSDVDIRDIEDTISRFEQSCRTLSNGKMRAKCDIYEIETPLSKLSYDEEFGYYVAPEDIEGQIKDTMSKNNYDHIFVIVRLRR